MGTSLGWLLGAGTCLPVQSVPSPGQPAPPQHLHPSRSVGRWVSPAHAATHAGGSGLLWGLLRGLPVWPRTGPWACGRPGSMSSPARHGDHRGAGRAGGRGVRTLLGVSRAAVFTFHLLKATTGDFFLFNFIFLRLCVSFTGQKPSCKHPAASPGGESMVMEEVSCLLLCWAAPFAPPHTHTHTCTPTHHRAR